MTIVELCIVIVVLAILLTTGVAGLFRARLMSNEAAAIAGLRAIYSAQFSFTAGCGRGYFATTLTSLTVPPPGSEVGYLSPDLGGSNTPDRNGYRFGLRPGQGGVVSLTDCLGRPTQTAYYASTTPVALGTTGARSFAMNQSGGIWALEGAIPPPEPFGAPAQAVK